MKRKTWIISVLIVFAAGAAALYLKRAADLSSHPVLYAVNMKQAQEYADSGSGYYLVGCRYSTGFDYYIAYGESEGELLLLTGNTPEQALNRYTFMFGTSNLFLIKGSLSEHNEPDKYKMMLEVHEWDIIAPIKRNYDDTYGRSGKSRWFSPKDYIDNFDIENGDFYMTHYHFPHL